MEDLEGYRIYLDWGLVLISVAALLEAEAYVQLPLPCEVCIYGPHSSARLTN